MLRGLILLVLLLIQLPLILLWRLEVTLILSSSEISLFLYCSLGVESASYFYVSGYCMKDVIEYKLK